MCPFLFEQFWRAATMTPASDGFPEGSHAMSQPEFDLKAPLRLGEFRSIEELRRSWNEHDVLLLPEVENGLYRVGFAASDRGVRRCQRIRFQVFNEELKEGLLASWSSGLDADVFDGQMDHLLLLRRSDNEVIGTYRLQSAPRAMKSQHGFYSAGEFDLSPILASLSDVVEAGRACIVRDYRSFATVILLWKGIAAYLESTGMRTIFGCCSLTSLDPDDGWRANKTLRSRGFLHRDLCARPMPLCSCGDPSREHDPVIGPAIKLPKLFGAYMRLGAQVISEPALDREFGTVDFLVLLDARRVTMSTFGVFS